VLGVAVQVDAALVATATTALGVERAEGELATDAKWTAWRGTLALAAALTLVAAASLAAGEATAAGESGTTEALASAAVFTRVAASAAASTGEGRGHQVDTADARAALFVGVTGAGLGIGGGLTDALAVDALLAEAAEAATTSAVGRIALQPDADAVATYLAFATVTAKLGGGVELGGVGLGAQLDVAGWS
jgi:hypothetical protein